MSSKQSKKIRQMFRREIKGTVQQLTKDAFETGDLFNQKPKYLPKFIWEKLQALVVNNNFRKNYETIQRKLKEGKDTIAETIK